MRNSAVAITAPKRVRKPKPSAPFEKKAVEHLATLSIIDACRDPQIFQPWFKDEQTWLAWFAFLKSMFGLALDEKELAIFQKHTGRSAPAPVGYYDVSVVVGRRGGKSLVLALVAAYLACFIDWTPYLTGGERGTIAVIAADRRQAGTIFKYLREMIGIPLLEGLIVRETNDLIELKNSITIEVQTASWRTTRGRTLVACAADELAFWRNDETGSNPDAEIINALKPAMATVPGARLLKASSPYARKGVLWTDFKKHHGQDASTTLVWAADTRSMNPTVPQSFIDAAYADDPASAAAEYGALFRDDVGSFLDPALIDAAVDHGVTVRPPWRGNSYVSFVDASSGRGDSFTCAVAHAEDGVAVLDCLIEVKPPFNPMEAVAEIAGMLREYGLRETTGDRYSIGFNEAAFAANAIRYRSSDRDRSAIYAEVLPLFTSGRVRLIDNARLIAQFASLERRPSSMGRDRIDHGPGGHDDLCNAASGALVHALAASRVPVFLFTSV